MRETDSSGDPGEAAPSLPKFEFLAGRLSLDFCNSLSRPNGLDRLGDAGAFAGWAVRAGRPLEAPPSPADLRAFLALRQTLRLIFDAVADAMPPAQEALDALAFAAGGAPQRLAWDNQAYRAIVRPTGGGLAQLRADILADAVALLTGADLDRVKRCPGYDCAWLFFDTSRNGKRRWCAMEDCGVKAKVRRFRDRHTPF